MEESYPDAQRVESDSQTDIVMLNSPSTTKRKHDKRDSFVVPKNPQPKGADPKTKNKSKDVNSVDGGGGAKKA